jgi:hypothetical protein
VKPLSIISEITTKKDGCGEVFSIIIIIYCTEFKIYENIVDINNENLDIS